MLFAVSGTQNAGKTTLVNDLVATGQFNPSDLPDYREVIKEQKLAYNQSGTLEAQRIIFDSLKQNVEDLAKRDGLYIMDRSPLDAYVYTRYLFKNTHLMDLASGMEWLTAIKQMESYIKQMPVFTFYVLPYNIPIVDDNFRDTDPKYRKAIDFMFWDCLNQLKQYVKFVCIEQSDREARVKEVIDLLTMNDVICSGKKLQGDELFKWFRKHADNSGNLNRFRSAL